MPTTTNYSWTTPADTDLVKDGASAIRTLGTAIDTTTKNLNPSTTLGDIEYRSSTTNVNTRLALGTAGQVLTVNSGATAPEWAAPAGTPIGTVIFYAANSAPTGFLKANGAAISRSTYASLFSAIGTTFGVGDGSTTFNVPDFRGYFPRGWADNGSVDSGRSFGSTQSATSFPVTTNAEVGYLQNVQNSDGDDGTVSMKGIGYDRSSNGTYKKTRPVNLALLACIKF